MKEIINYFYSIYPNKITNIDNGVYFCYLNFKYYFIKYNRDVKELNLLVKISNDLYDKGVMVDTFIVSNKGTFYVSVDNEMYVMLRVNGEEDDNLSLKELYKFNNLLISKDLNMSEDWASLWEKKVDMFESEVSDINNDYPYVQASFDYYVGLAENAISYFRDTLIEEDIRECKINLNHNRISSNVYSGQINNPLMFTFDYEVRDIAEYIKSKFFNSTLDYFEVEDLIVKNDFSRCSLRFLFARLLYPSYYFDSLHDIFVYEEDEKKLLKYIDKISEYEDFLMDVYNMLNKKVGMVPVEWIINNS